MKKHALIFVGMLAGLMAQAAQESTVYSYDEAGRLTAAYVSRAATNSAALFAYDLAGNRACAASYAPAVTDDLDADGLNDSFSLAYFGELGAGGAADPDGDGLVNSNECALGGDPTADDTDQDGMPDYNEFIAGTALNDSRQCFDVTNALPFAGSQLRILCETKAGRTYQLQRTFNLMSSWTGEGAAYAALANGSHTFEAAIQTNAHYRIVVWVTAP